MPAPASPESRQRPLTLLIDGYSLVFRSYFVLAAQGREMHAPDGLPTTALYSFTTMLLNVLEKFQPDHVVIALDAHGPTFRETIYPAYKGHREEAPEDLKVQLEALRTYLTDVGLPWYELPEYEADDLLGTFAQRAVAAGQDVAIITGDKDVLQLASPAVTVFLTRIGTSDLASYGPAEVQERFGVTPEHFVDYKALLGDTSDNIPGVPGIGDKTAQQLLAQYPTVEDLLAHIDEVEPKGARKKLAEHAEQARLSKKLSAIATDAPIAWDAAQQPRYTFDVSRFRGWLTRLGFRSLLTRYNLAAGDLPASAMPDTPAAASGAVRVTILRDLRELETLEKQIRKAGRVAFDFETTGLNPRTADLVGIAMCVDPAEGVYLPVGHHGSGSLLDTTGAGAADNLPLDKVLTWLKLILEDPSISKTVQNGKYEHAVCRRYGITLRGLDFDTFVASYVLDPDARHGLKDMAQTHLGLVWGRIEDLIGSGKQQRSMAEVPVADAAGYAVHDAVATARLREVFAPEIESEGLQRLFAEVEVPLVPVLADMESEGIRVDPRVLEDLALHLNRRMTAIETEAVAATGGQALNLNSPKQLSEFLFRDLGLPNPKKGSTDIEVLEELREAHPLVPLVIEYRELAKLKGTYVQGLLPLIEDDGRIHTSYNQGVAATGRLSSANPNLQNIPIRTELGRQIRKAFVPREGYALLAADYSQIELRLLAHYSGDEALIGVYEHDGDIHTETAVKVLGMDPDHPDPEKRRQAKAINFGIIYGMGPFSLSRSLGIPLKEAERYIAGYFARFPRVRKFLDQVLADGREKGYVETFLGRRRYFPDLVSPNKMKRGMAERAAMNMPLQGGASDLIKMAMVQVAPQLRPLEAYMLLQVHDELVFEAPAGRIGALADLAGPVMANAWAFRVPIQVDLGAGPSWYDIKKTSTARSGDR